MSQDVTPPLERIATALETLVELLSEEDTDQPVCRLTLPYHAGDEVIDAAVSRLMSATKLLTRSELHELINNVFNDGVRSVIHERA